MHSSHASHTVNQKRCCRQSSCRLGMLSRNSSRPSSCGSAAAFFSMAYPSDVMIAFSCTQVLPILGLFFTHNFKPHGSYFLSELSLLLPSLWPILEDPPGSLDSTHRVDCSFDLFSCQITCIVSQKSIWSCRWGFGA